MLLIWVMPLAQRTPHFPFTRENAGAGGAQANGGGGGAPAAGGAAGPLQRLVRHPPRQPAGAVHHCASEQQQLQAHYGMDVAPPSTVLWHAAAPVRQDERHPALVKPMGVWRRERECFVQGRRSSTASGGSAGGSAWSSEHAPSTGGRTPVSGLANEEHGQGINPLGGACGSAGAAPASWGVVCLAVLGQRASDKSAAVRSKAVSLLGAVVAEAFRAASTDGELGTFRRVCDGLDPEAIGACLAMLVDHGRHMHTCACAVDADRRASLDTMPTSPA